MIDTNALFPSDLLVQQKYKMSSVRVVKLRKKEPSKYRALAVAVFKNIQGA